MTNWGLLSTARINDALLRGIAEVPDVQALAVASRDAGRANAYARAHGIERAYGSYEQLLADPDVDVVYISLPNGMHVEWTHAALEAGKHVLCEKPLSRSPAEVERLFDLADERGLYLSEAFMYRHHPQTKRLKQLVDEGAIGELRLIRGDLQLQLRSGRPAHVGRHGGRRPDGRGLLPGEHVALPGGRARARECRAVARRRRRGCGAWPVCCASPEA